MGTSQLFHDMLLWFSYSVLALELKTNRKQYEDRARELVQRFAKDMDRHGIRKVSAINITQKKEIVVNKITLTFPSNTLIDVSESTNFHRMCIKYL